MFEVSVGEMPVTGSLMGWWTLFTWMDGEVTGDAVGISVTSLVLPALLGSTCWCSTCSLHWGGGGVFISAEALRDTQIICVLSAGTRSLETLLSSLSTA